MNAKKLSKQRLVHGVGLNNADYDVVKYKTTKVNGVQKRKQVWMCPFYRAWKNMLERCYSAKLQERYPTYIGCTVSEEWSTFSNFKAWMETQDWEGKQLDKDILVEGNKVYSADTCVFVTQTVNLFITDSNAARGECLLGVDWIGQAGKFRARCSNPFTKKRENLGRFAFEQEAYNAWAKRKLELAHELAPVQTDARVAKALISKYENYNNGNLPE